MNQEDKKTLDFLKEDMEENGAVVVYITSEGDLMLVTTGELKKPQIKVAERVLTAAKPSIVLSIVLFIEISLIKLEERVLEFAAKLFKRV